MKNRVSQTSMRKLLNIIQYTQNYRKQGLVISLDAEKVEWPYLFSTMERFGLGGDFINLVKLIYRSLRASVLVNDMQSPEFVLGRSTHQGDPLS